MTMASRHTDYLHGNNLKLSYSEEDKEHPEKIREWKKNMKEKYGKGGEFYKCSFDNLYFYISKSDIIPHVKCSKCNYYLCSYCDNRDKVEINIGNCCVRGRVRKFFVEDAYIYIKSDEFFGGEKKAPLNLLHLIPLLNICYLVGGMSLALFWKLDGKDQYNYESKMKNSGCFIYSLIIFLNWMFTFLVSIPFAAGFHILFLIFYIFSFLTGRKLLKKYLGIVHSCHKD